ncbi:PAAR-like protein [Clostridium formicaceticum]|uniref:DUF4280 domain-containing protein n=1 Tax=Clostridium formicaceticum TaxID=1497 RepID=A0AAC9RRW4_9CLOT|nr:PAAR-like protein [Clostridium formicaceticum]AOY74683.1 hypothetical protein BJL90_01165 [Clostridium formicaceticum]ARE89060.1 hypothetical protein CLFO_34660 [Clostridium formicaceticum]
MKKVVTTGCKTKCSWGTMPSNIKASNDVIINGKSVITAKDTNGMFFGLCSSSKNPAVSAANGTPQSCQPKLALFDNWTETAANCYLSGKKAATESSTIKCMWEGNISFTETISTVLIGTNSATIEGTNRKQGDSCHDVSAGEVVEPAGGVNSSISKEVHISNNIKKEVDKTSAKKEQELCPICNSVIDEKHNSMYYDGKTNPKVWNKPEMLKCEKLPGEKVGAYRTASHHIIPVNEVYNKFSDLVAITVKAGYDINSPANGLPLPTPIGANPYKVYEENGELITLNFGELEKSERKTIAFKYMRELGLQWHSGGHSYTLNEDYLHQSYTKEVTKLINELEIDLYHSNLCLQQTDKRELIVSEMNKISDKIKKKLLSFKTPKISRPFYVSKLAADFAKEDN